MKKSSRFMVSALIASAGLTFSISAQAGLFDALLAIPEMAVNVAMLAIKIPFKIDELILSLFVDSSKSPSTEDNAERSSQFASMDSYDQQHKQFTNETTHQLITEIFLGLNEFQASLNTYKTPDKYGDCSNPNGPNCYSALSITSVNGSDTIKDPNQQKAAKSYSSFASGSGSSLPAPDPSWTPTPQVIAYTNNYRTNMASQSSQINHVSNSVANRLPADNDQGNVSSYEFTKNTTYKSNVSQKSQDVVSKVPVIGWMYNIGHGVTSIVGIASHGSDQLDNLSNMTSSNTSMLSQTQNQLSGRQMYHDAVASQTGEPNKKKGQ